MLYSRSLNPNRKLHHTLECVAIGRTWVCVNTQRANELSLIILNRRLLLSLPEFGSVKKECVYSAGTRFDFGLFNSENQNAAGFIEVKSVTLKLKPQLAQFPDAVTQRGQKHLKELIKATQKGLFAGLIFLIMRSDCNSFSPAEEIDPQYALLLTQAQEVGVKIYTPVIRVTQKGFYLKNQQLKLAI